MKRAWRVDRADLIAEILEKAFHLAESGQPGPVLVNVPMDILVKLYHQKHLIAFLIICDQ